MSWQPAEDRYETMTYNRCGRPASSCRPSRSACGTISARTRRTRPSAPSAARPSTSASPISTWPTITARRPARRRTAFGEILRTDFAGFRDELMISTKAGYGMWPGPYGEWGSRKYMLASLDQSLKRMGLDYVDIFYSHRYDPDTPLEETMGALDQRRALRQGALCRHLLLQFAAHPRGCRHPALARHALHHPPAQLFDDQPLGRGGRAAGHAGRARHRLDRLLAAGAGHADGKYLGGHSGGQPRRAGQVAASRPSSTRRRSPTSARSTRSPEGAARRWRRWRWPGCCAAAA